ncbi:MAG TPA: bifunctional DNA primase/polymerase, partial [Nitrososphaeraceae archaeon]
MIDFAILDYWFYTVGSNIIPIKFKQKKPHLSTWKEWQNKAIPVEVYEKWKKDGLFKGGYGIFTGTLWRGPNQGKYLVCIDIDNKKGLEEFFSFNPLECNNINDLASKTLVVQHEDAKLDRAHIYLVTDKPIAKKSGISGVVNKNKEENLGIPAIEVKSNSTTYMVGPECMHQNGFFYKITGTNDIKVLGQEETTIIEDMLNRIYQKFTKNKKHYQNNNNSHLPTIKEMDEDDYEVIEGNNRHMHVLRKLDSWYSRSNRTLTFKELIERANLWNQRHCKPPLDNSVITELTNQAMGWIESKQSNENKFQSGGSEKDEFKSNNDDKKQQEFHPAEQSELFKKIGGNKP